jgi:tetratricopeptide (TPR) repeat protein
MLLRWLNQKPASPESDRSSARIESMQVIPDAGELLRQAEQCAASGDHHGAVAAYQQLIGRDPLDAQALNNMGAALFNLGRFVEAESYFRRAIAAREDLTDAHNNLGLVLRMLGRVAQSEAYIRRAVEGNPVAIDYQVNLADTLLMLGRTRDAASCLSQVLEAVPDHTEAIVGLGNIARMEGQFADAEQLFKRALVTNHNLPGVWASLASLRRMTVADSDWLRAAQELATSGVPTTAEIGLWFAIGKYWDDLREFERAFHSYERANRLLKSTARDYDGAGRAAYVADMIRIYTPERMRQLREGGGASSAQPVLVVGMPRSGTSLVEQIIASHPAARGAGELGFWTESLFAHAVLICRDVLPESLRKQLAEQYLKVLAEHGGDAGLVVDKAPVNSEYLGFIYSVFPNIRVIYMQRDPIDTCLSCYFQYLSPALSYTMDLTDLAHYYRTHHRLMTHWRAVLPPGSLLDVPYEQLVADQELWTRKILQFLGLDWDSRCLEFHSTKRAVLTSSSWQVRQKLYRSSIERWRQYEKFIGPLLGLRDLDT